MEIPACPPPEELERLLNEQLPPADQRRVSDHVAGCLACQKTLETLTEHAEFGGGPSPRRSDEAQAKPRPEFLERIKQSPPATTTAEGREDDGDDKDRLPVLKDYEILEVLGRGGEGVVYKAMHLPLRRLVALKMMHDSYHAEARVLARFRIEAETLARLHHHNIVQVHEVGSQEGRPFFAMEYVPAGPLSARLTGQPLPARDAAALIETLARAVHAAHQAGVIHRDLKPANVLLGARGGAFGEPKISDFGLAKRERDGAALTRTGAVMGTPAYMAPEQARGDNDAVDGRCDVYAMGSILYHLLTGRPPFVGASAADVMLQVVHDEPAPPRRLFPQASRDLETICMKCLRKEPRQRYASAGDLAGDCAAFLRGEPVKARPVGRLERAWFWARRRPAAAAAWVLAVLAIIFGLGGGGALALWGNAEAGRRREHVLADKADQARKVAEGLAEQLDQTTYLHSVQLAHRHWQDGEVEQAIQVLDGCPEERRGWEWRYVKRLTQPMMDLSGLQAAPTSVAFSADGTRLVFGDYSDGLKICDAADGRELAVLEQSAPSRAPNGHTIMAGELPVHAVFTPDGRVLSCLTAGLLAWDPVSGKPLGSPLGRLTPAMGCLAISPDGTRMASGAGGTALIDTLVHIWNLRDGKELPPLTGHDKVVFAVAYGAGGKLLASGGEDQAVRLWDADSGKELFALRGFGGPVEAVDFRPDGRRLAAAGLDGTVKVWDVADGRELFSANAWVGPANALVYSPDGKRLAAGMGDGTVVVWNADAGREAFTLRGHAGATPAVAALSYSPDGTRIATAGGDRTVKVWDATGPQEAHPYRIPAKSFIPVALTAPGLPYLAFAGPGGGPVEVWSADERRLVAKVAADDLNMPLLGTVSADGARLAFVGAGGAVRLWDAGAAAGPRVLQGHSGVIEALALSGDGGRLATAGGAGNGPGEVKLWDAATGRTERTLAPPARVNALSLSTDGRLLAACLTNRVLIVWNAETGEELFRGEGDSLACPVFSPDGKQLAAASGPQAHVWDIASGVEVWTLRCGALVTQLAFNSDGRGLATAEASRAVTLWDLSCGKDALTLKIDSNASVMRMAFSADGARLIGCLGGGRVVVWDAAPRPSTPVAVP